jgi:hypothetical protein
MVRFLLVRDSDQAATAEWPDGKAELRTSEVPSPPERREEKFREAGSFQGFEAYTVRG